MAVRTFGISGKTDSAEDYRITASGLLVPASALNPRTGTLSAPVLTGTGSFTCTVSPCTVAIDGTSNSLQAGYLVTNDLTTTVTIAAASAAARTDLICLQVLDNTYDGSGQSKGQITYVQGTSGGGVPATPASSIVLWQVPVGASAGSVNFAAAVAAYPFTAAAGGIVAVRNSADKPAVVNGVQYRHRLDVGAGTNPPLEWSVDGVTYYPVYDLNTAKGLLPTYTSTTRPASPSVGLVIYETDTANVMVWNGAAWVSVLTITPTFTSLTGTGIWSGATFSITKVGGQCYFRGTLTASSTPTSSATVCSTLPAAFQPANSRFISATSLIPGWPAVMLLIAGGVISIYATGSATAGGTAYLDGASYWLS